MSNRCHKKRSGVSRKLWVHFRKWMSRTLKTWFGRMTLLWTKDTAMSYLQWNIYETAVIEVRVEGEKCKSFAWFSNFYLILVCIEVRKKDKHAFVHKNMHSKTKIKKLKYRQRSTPHIHMHFKNMLYKNCTHLNIFHQVIGYTHTYNMNIFSIISQYGVASLTYLMTLLLLFCSVVICV